LSKADDGKTACLSGLVVSGFGRHYIVEDDSGQRVICHPRGKKSLCVVGDRVRWQVSGDEGVIEALEPRRNLLFRQDDWKTKAFAANLDQVLVMVAAEPVFSVALAGPLLGETSPWFVWLSLVPIVAGCSLAAAAGNETTVPSASGLCGLARDSLPAASPSALPEQCGGVAYVDDAVSLLRTCGYEVVVRPDALEAGESRDNVCWAMRSCWWSRSQLRGLGTAVRLDTDVAPAGRLSTITVTAGAAPVTAPSGGQATAAAAAALRPEPMFELRAEESWSWCAVL
jgi:hypothetical protein